MCLYMLLLVQNWGEHRESDRGESANANHITFWRKCIGWLHHKMLDGFLKFANVCPLCQAEAHLIIEYNKSMNIYNASSRRCWQKSTFKNLPQCGANDSSIPLAILFSILRMEERGSRSIKLHADEGSGPFL